MMTPPITSELKPTPTIEDYLAIMFIMERDGEDIIAARLAESLEVSAPTVTVTLRRMERDGYIELEDRKHIHLTEIGCDAASSVIRRHMLTEWMLARILKMPLSEVHSEAHAIEHSLSAEIEAKMVVNLNDPQVCPHGNPFPGCEFIADGWIQLSQMQGGEKLIIRRIHETVEKDLNLMQFLEKNGVVPGAEVRVDEILPFNQTLTLSVGENKVVLGISAAENIYAETQAEPY